MIRLGKTLLESDDPKKTFKVSFFSLERKRRYVGARKDRRKKKRRRKSRPESTQKSERCFLIGPEEKVRGSRSRNAQRREQKISWPASERKTENWITKERRLRGGRNFVIWRGAEATYLAPRTTTK